MKNITLLCALCAVIQINAVAAKTIDTVTVYQAAVPIIVNNNVNPVFDIWFNNTQNGSMLDGVEIKFSPDTPLQYIESVELFYTGTTSMFRSRSRAQGLAIHADRFGGGQKIYKHPAYAMPKGKISQIMRTIKIESDQKLFVGENYFYVSIKVKKETPLTALFDATISSVEIDGSSAPLLVKGYTQPLRVGVSVRNAGDDGVDSYRIPGLVTAKNGDLLAVYDIRNTSSTDLQEDIQVGLSRSANGGKTWMPMQTIINMNGYGVLPASQNGVGDPAILVDDKTGRVWAVALWNYGIGADRGWNNLKQGLEPEDQAAQIVVAYSDNQGKTWSEPINITKQVKKPEWFITLQGPGRGITMKDGTLVFAFQYVDTNKLPYSTIIYSKDGGKSWKTGTGPRENTTEAQVVETEQGTLMLNMRDNKSRSRSVFTTSDMGLTWTEHPSSRKALVEPVCMASLLKTTYQGKEILLFSNPNSTKGRVKMTIKVSTDMGLTWSEGILLDEEPNWGYSCLSMVDQDTVGILYEGSRSEMTFQKIRLADFFN